MRSVSWLHALSIVFVVVIGYVLGPTRLPLIGEETRRAEIGIEMAESGDWIVATDQYVPILDRPPLQYWCLALVQEFVHPLDLVTLRMFMAAVTLLTALMVWWYARHVLSPTGALIAGLVVPTMAHVFDIGRRAETDGLFAALLAAALLVWHHGYSSGWPRTRTWAAGAILASLATLAKGLQGPVAFFGTTWLFLLLRREHRSLWSGAHLTGLVAFALPILAWAVPFHWREGWAGARMTWLEPGTSRVPSDVTGFVWHFVEFPVRVFAAMLPWSILLVATLDRRFREDRSERWRSAMLFAAVGVSTILVPNLVVEGRTRYVVPMYPLIAVICGAVVERGVELRPTYLLGRAWRDFARGIAVLSVVLLLVLCAVPLLRSANDSRVLEAMGQPRGLLALFGAAVVMLAPWLWLRANDRESPRVGRTAMIVALLLAATFNGPLLQMRCTTAEDVGPKIAAFRESLPDGQCLVSFEPLHHKFVYFYDDYIPIRPWPRDADELDTDWFAMNASLGATPALPFAWERVAEFNMQRSLHDRSITVVVGRRVPPRPDPDDHEQVR